MFDSFDIAVVGGGIAGLSAAALLSRGANVAVLEAEDQPGYHATGRSAAIFAQNYGPPLVRALSAWSHAAYRRTLPETLSPRGLIRFGTVADRDQTKSMFDEMSEDMPLTWLEAEDLAEMHPLLREEYRACGFANPDAEDMDVAAILQAHFRDLKANGGQLCRNFRVAKTHRNYGKWTLNAESGKAIEAAVIVNAAGAWADEVAAIAGAIPLGLQPLRRSAVTFDAPAGTEIANLPMAVDIRETVYLKPEAGRLMASPCDETLSPPTDSRPEEIDIAICLDRVAKCFDLAPGRPKATWSGLRTFSPDRIPVCGWDSTCPDFFWLAGQGGYGVQSAPALARLTADLVAGHGAHAANMPDIRLASLSPERFG